MALVTMRASRSVRRVLNPGKWLDCPECGFPVRMAQERCPWCGFEVGFFERLTQCFATTGSALAGADEVEWIVKEGGSSSPATLRKRLADAGWADAEIEIVFEMLRRTEKTKIETPRPGSRTTRRGRARY
jgi:hypothetical protein